MPRLYVGPGLGLKEGALVALPEGATRHVQVLRLQPGDPVCVFDGTGGEWQALITKMGRREAEIQVGVFSDAERELSVEVTLAMGIPANDRMDTVVEKATELGVASIQPLICERSVLRLDGERAAKKVAHWQGVAIAACEQSGRTRVPTIQPVQSLRIWLASQAESMGTCAGSDSAPIPQRGVLSLRQALWVGDWLERSAVLANTPQADTHKTWLFLSGPEGGLSESEEAAALAAGWSAVSLGTRILRADTAPMTVMGLMSVFHSGR